MSEGASKLRAEIRKQAMAEQKKADAILGRIGVEISEEERGTVMQQAKKRAGVHEAKALVDLKPDEARKVALELLSKDHIEAAKSQVEAWGWLLDNPKVKQMIRKRPGLIDPRSPIGALAQREVEIEGLAKSEAKKLQRQQTRLRAGSAAPTTPRLDSAGSSAELSSSSNRGHFPGSGNHEA